MIHGSKRKFFILIPIIFIALIPWVIMMLWNHVVVDIFIIKSITYWQALGLFVLSRILFGSMGFGGRRRNKCRRHPSERFLHMNANEKKSFIDAWKRKTSEE